MTNALKKEIWAIAGGKGGVGKSLLSVNMGIELAQKGKSVALIDADFGGANMHTFFGTSSSRISISDFIKSNELDFEDILVPTGIDNLVLASGAHDVLGMNNPNPFQQNKLIKALNFLKYEIIIIDLGAGIAPYILDLFIMANNGILVTAPEPTSMENTYRFVKSAFYRKLKSVISHTGVRGLLERITESKHEDNPKTPSDLINEISNINFQAGETLKFEIASFNPKLIINQVRTPSDVRVGFSMRQASQKHFGINLDYTGFVEFDNAVLSSIRMRKPVLNFAPNAPVSHCIRRVTHNIQQNYHLVPTN